MIQFIKKNEDVFGGPHCGKQEASYALRAVIPSRRYGWGLAYRQLRSLRSLAGGYDCIALRAGNAACGG